MQKSVKSERQNFSGKDFVNMKKIMTVFLAACVLTFALCACNGNNSGSSASSAANSTDSAQSQDEISSGADSQASSESNDDSSASESSAASSTGGESSKAVQLTENDVLDAYTKCAQFKAYWYEGGNSDAMVNSDDTIDFNGMQYCKYSSDGITTLADLKAAALKMVSEDVFTLWQDSLEYIDNNGELYGPVNYGVGDSDGFAGTESECVKISDDEYQLKVGNYYYASYVNGGSSDEKVLVGEYTCDYSLMDDGWIFTSYAYKSVNSFAG